MVTKQFTMKSPYTGEEMSIKKEMRKMSFRKDEFDVVIHTYKCGETGEQFEDEHFSELNYKQEDNLHLYMY